MSVEALCPSFAPASCINLTLVVDDDPAAAEELSDALEMAGQPCLVAHSWAAAAELFLANRDITAVVTDFYLSGQKVGYRNGLDLLDQLRGFDPDRDLTCLIISGDANVRADCAMSRQIGFLPKPAGPHQILRLLNSMRGGQTMSEQRSESEAARPQNADEALIMSDALADQSTGLVGAASLLRMMAEQAGHADLQDLAQLVLERSVALDCCIREVSKI